MINTLNIRVTLSMLRGCHSREVQGNWNLMKEEKINVSYPMLIPDHALMYNGKWNHLQCVK